MKTKILNDAYPKLYKDMYFECSDGWYQMIKDLSEEIYPLLEEGMQAIQVKEKYGRLCFYVTCANDEIYKIIDKYEDLSMKTCEMCGKPGMTIQDRGWYTTLCPEHHGKPINEINSFYMTTGHAYITNDDFVTNLLKSKSESSGSI